MGTRQLFSLAVLLGVWFLAFTEAAYKRDYGHHRGKKPAAEIGRSPRASYPNRQPEIPALYSAPKPQKLQQEPDQSANDVEFSDQQSTTTEIPFEQDQIVIDAAEDGAEIPEHDDDEGTSEDYQLQGTATEKPAALQEDPSLNEFPTLSSLTDDDSSYFRRKPVPNSYERGHMNANTFRPQERQQENQNSREDTPSQYLPPVISPSPQRSPQQNEYNAPSGSGYSSPPTQNQNAQQRRLSDQQQIETKPFQNHLPVQIASPNPNEEQNGRVNQVETNIPPRQYLPQYAKEAEGGNNGYSYAVPSQPQPQQAQSPGRFSSSPSQNEIPNYSSGKKDESEPLQLEGLSSSIVDAELLQRVQQIIEEHEKQQKEYLEKQFRENDNAFSQTNRQSTTGGYNNDNDNNVRIPLQAQHSPSSPSPYFRDGNGENFESRNLNANERSFEQRDYFERQPQQTPNYGPPQPQQFGGGNGNAFGDFRVEERQQIAGNAPSSRQFDFGGYSDSGEPQGRGFGEKELYAAAAPAFRDVGNSIFSQDEPENGGVYGKGVEQRDQEQRTSKLNNYGIGGERPEGKSQPLKPEPEIEYQKAVLSTHFTETQPDPAFRAQQQNSGEYLPPTPQARLHGNSQFSSPAQLATPTETRSSVNADNQNGAQHTNNEAFQYYQTEQIPFQQPQASFPTQQQSQNQIPGKNTNEPEFTSVNVNAGLIVSSQGQDLHNSAGDVIYGVPSSNLDLRRQEAEPGAIPHFQQSNYPTTTNNQNAQEQTFFRQQQNSGENGEQTQSQYLPPFQAQGQFRPEAEQVEQINTNPFTAQSHALPNQHNNQNVISKAQDVTPHQNPEDLTHNAFANEGLNSPANANNEQAYGFGDAQPQQTPYYQQHSQTQSFFQQGRPGASFFNNNNNNAQTLPTDNENSGSFFSGVQKGNEIQEPQGQSEQDTVPRPLYGIPLAPVISIDSGEDFRGSHVDFSSAPPSSFFNDGENRDSAQGFSFPATHAINNNYLTPQALVETPFNAFPQQPQQQLFNHQQTVSSPVYGIPTQQQTQEPLNNAHASNNNRNDEPNGYGNARNDNSPHLDQIPLVSNTVSVPTRDYSPPTSYSYSNRLHTPVTSSSTNSYGRIRKRLASSMH